MSRFVIREVRVGPDELRASMPILGDTVDIRTAPDGGQVFIARLDAPLKYRIGDDFASHRSPQPVINDEFGPILWISAVAFRPAHPGQAPHYGMRAFPVELAYVIDPAYVEDPHADPASIDIVGLVEIDDDDDEADAPNGATMPVQQAPAAGAQEVAPPGPAVDGVDTADSEVEWPSGDPAELDVPPPAPRLSAHEANDTASTSADSTSPSSEARGPDADPMTPAQDPHVDDYLDADPPTSDVTSLEGPPWLTAELADENPSTWVNDTSPRAGEIGSLDDTTSSTPPPVDAVTPSSPTSSTVDEFDAIDPVPALDTRPEGPQADREDPISEIPQLWPVAAPVDDEPPTSADDTSPGMNEQFSGSEEYPAAATPASPAVEEITPISLAGDIIDDDEVDTVDPARAQDLYSALYTAYSQIEATGLDVPAGEAPTQSRPLADETVNDEPAHAAAGNLPTIDTGEDGTTNNGAVTDEMAGRTQRVPAERPPGRSPTTPATSQSDAACNAQGEDDDAAGTPSPTTPLTDEMAQRTAPLRRDPATREPDAPQRAIAGDQSQPDDRLVITPPPSAESLDDTPPAGTSADRMANRPWDVGSYTADNAPRAARVPAKPKDAGSVEAEVTEVVQRSHLAVPAAPPAAPRRSPDRGIPGRGAFPHSPPPRPTGFTPRGGNAPAPGPAYARPWPSPPTDHPAPAPMPARSGPGTPPPMTPWAVDFQVSDFQHRSRIRPAVFIAVGAVIVIVSAVVGYLLLRPSNEPDTSTAPSSSTKASDPEQDQLMKLLPKGYPAGACKPTLSDTATEIACTRNTDPGGPLSGTYSLHRDKAALDAALAKILRVPGQVNCPGNIQSPGPWRRNAAPESPAGTLYCAVHNGQPTIAWTNDADRVLNVVQSGPQGSPTLDQLYAWWSTHS